MLRPDVDVRGAGASNDVGLPTGVYRRLAAIKSTDDLHKVFRLSANIKPAR